MASIFRLIVGAALAARHGYDFPTWGAGNTATGDVRKNVLLQQSQPRGSRSKKDMKSNRITRRRTAQAEVCGFVKSAQGRSAGAPWGRPRSWVGASVGGFASGVATRGREPQGGGRRRGTQILRCGRPTSSHAGRTRTRARVPGCLGFPKWTIMTGCIGSKAGVPRSLTPNVKAQQPGRWATVALILSYAARPAAATGSAWLIFRSTPNPCCHHMKCISRR